MEALMDLMAEQGQYEPSITSDNPVERKLARQLRLERRLEVLRRASGVSITKTLITTTGPITEGGGGVSGSSQDVTSPISEQIRKSIEFLTRMKKQGEESLTNIKVANEARENTRRVKEGFNQSKILEELQQEAEAATVNYNMIADQWVKILEYKDPLHMNDGILEQKAKFDEILRQKDGIIAMLRQEIKKAETAYNNDLLKQESDINMLAKRVETQNILMRKAFRKELEAIEEAILDQRKTYLDFITKTWNELAKNRDDTERQLLDQKMEEIDNFHKEMELLEQNFNEMYRETKIKLEYRCDELLREFEKLKACALLNHEKLDYNYLILKKREDENVIIKSQQKRKLNKLQEQIVELRKEIQHYQTHSAEELVKLDTQIKTLKQSILAIEKRADHFAKVNNETFRDVWQMNEEKAKSLYHSILNVDRLIYENQLGIEWVPPKPLEVHYQGLVDFKSVLQVLALIHKTKSTKSIIISDKTVPVEGIPFLEKETQSYRRLLKHILEQIANKGDFLVENQIETILLPYNRDEKCLVSIDNVFNALHVKQKDDIDLLCKYFIPYMHCPVCCREQNISKLSEESDENEDSIDEKEDASVSESAVTVEPSQMAVSDSSVLTGLGELTAPSLESAECRGPSVYDQKTVESSTHSQQSTKITKEKLVCNYNHPLVINPVFVLKALKEFLGAYHTPKPKVPTMGDRLNYKRDTPSRLITNADLEIYWKRYSNSFSKEKIQLWDLLLEGLKRYHELLKERRQLAEEVVGLRRQNAELKYLFVNYADKEKFPME